jgi:pantothenate kinase
MHLTNYPKLKPKPSPPSSQTASKPSTPTKKKTSRRTLIALAGGPGSGKTFIAYSIASAVTQRGLKAQAVSIEGFVKPSHVLTDEQEQHEGAIDTFDGEAVVNFLKKKLRELGPGA